MKRTLLMLLILIALPGCSWTGGKHPVMSEVWPVYQVPAQPLLDLPATIVPGKSPELDVMLKNLYDTTRYADTLKIIVETHNQAAKAHNQQVEQDLGIGK